MFFTRSFFMFPNTKYYNLSMKNSYSKASIIKKLCNFGFIKRFSYRFCLVSSIIE
jgi:hypothetical protein